MENFKLTDCESILLLDLITQLLTNLEFSEYSSKHVLPSSQTIDLTGVDIKVLRSLQFKFDIYVV